mmetsp:Transcript_9371/g.22178  ORF Transcript_9371/g.22178 Transcript_9371/m.22178 type:complete len:95 (+) Transcript_9371:366-650(+)
MDQFSTIPETINFTTCQVWCLQQDQVLLYLNAKYESYIWLLLCYLKLGAFTLRQQQQHPTKQRQQFQMWMELKTPQWVVPLQPAAQSPPIAHFA